MHLIRQQRFQIKIRLLIIERNTAGNKKKTGGRASHQVIFNIIIAKGRMCGRGGVVWDVLFGLCRTCVADCIMIMRRCPLSFCPPPRALPSIDFLPSVPSKRGRTSEEQSQRADGRLRNRIESKPNQTEYTQSTFTTSSMLRSATSSVNDRYIYLQGVRENRAPLKLSWIRLRV